MGASAREIEAELKETRDPMDEKVARLEGGRATGVVRYWRWAAVGVGVLGAAGIAFLVYRRTRKPQWRDRLGELSVKRLRGLLERFREELPSVTVILNDKGGGEPGIVESTVRTVAPALIGTASTAVLERIAHPPERARRAS